MKSSLGGTTLVALAVVLFARTAIQFYGGEKPPFAGFRVPLEPSFLVRLRFSWGALPMINEGYSKVRNLGRPLHEGELIVGQFKDSFYRLARNDRDILVISNKYVDELRGLPQDKLSSIQALIAVR